MRIDTFSITQQQQWFDEMLSDLSCTTKTRAYIAGVCFEFVKSTDGLLSDRSIVIEYARAKERGEFQAFQRIGDYVLWINAFYAAQIKDNMEIVEMVGQLSYMKCHRLLMNKWEIFEELADTLPTLTHELKKSFSKENATVPVFRL